MKSWKRHQSPSTNKIKTIYVLWKLTYDKHQFKKNMIKSFHAFHTFVYIPALIRKRSVFLISRAGILTKVWIGDINNTIKRFFKVFRKLFIFFSDNPRLNGTMGALFDDFPKLGHLDVGHTLIDCVSTAVLSNMSKNLRTTNNKIYFSGLDKIMGSRRKF